MTDLNVNEFIERITPVAMNGNELAAGYIARLAAAKDPERELSDVLDDVVMHADKIVEISRAICGLEMAQLDAIIPLLPTVDEAIAANAQAGIRLLEIDLGGEAA